MQTIKKLIITSALTGVLSPTVSICAMAIDILDNTQQIMVDTDAPHATEAIQAYNQQIEANNRLLEAAKHNNLNEVIAALNDKADVNTKDFFNYTPLHYAARNHNTALVKLLISHNADINALSYCQETALHEAHDHASTVGVLLHYGAQVNIPNNIQQTPLLMAIMRDNGKAVKMLMQAGANPDILNIYGKTAWQTAESNLALLRTMHKNVEIYRAQALADMLSNTHVLKQYLFEAGIVGVVKEYAALLMMEKKQKKKK